MTCINDNQSNPPLLVKLAAGLALSAFLVLGPLVSTANAQGGGDDHNRWVERGNNYGWDHRGERRHNEWERRHYHPTPPVVYGSPYYYPPPVIYDPGYGMNLPNLSIRVR
ncbi:putative Sulfur globule protein [Azospirillaceae bacterium]